MQDIKQQQFHFFHQAVSKQNLFYVLFSFISGNRSGFVSQQNHQTQGGHGGKRKGGSLYLTKHERANRTHALGGAGCVPCPGAIIVSAFAGVMSLFCLLADLKEF
jgi:ABC-type nickel/cobalt efflux system permease component RcnA